MVTLQMSAHSYPRGVSFGLAWDKRLIQHEDIDDFEYQMKLAVRMAIISQTQQICYSDRAEGSGAGSRLGLTAGADDAILRASQDRGRV